MNHQNQKFKTLKRIFHEDSSDERFENNQRLADRRREDMSAFRTGIALYSGELFYTTPQELITLVERVLRLERKVSHLWRSLPTIARRSYIRDLVTQEVVFTNQIEGVRSTRKEIEEALANYEQFPEDRGKKQFREFASLYLNLTREQIGFPKSPDDIRSIFDDVMEGQLDEEDVLDGRLFRREPVEVRGGHRLVHVGVTPESRIIEMLESMIQLVEHDDSPAVINAVLSHFLFEYVHPFYDGNGKTGRFLLALYLSEPLSMATALSVSKSIAENVNKYYKAFEEVEDRLNHGEATYFIIVMMEIILSAQEGLVDELVEKDRLLTEGLGSIEQLGLTNDREKAIIYGLLQVQLFATVPAATLEQLAQLISRSKSAARKYLARLEEMGYVQIVSRRPLKFMLTDRTRTLVGYSTRDDYAHEMNRIGDD
ncbi:MAG: Fic family protein [Coriobacteriia bacterium]|nr:Fic family protein [Coriobacteriia bacterium]MCL2537006.1 Fic family protein [Coriobacteriia bacterium]